MLCYQAQMANSSSEFQKDQQFKLTNADSHCVRLCHYWNQDMSELNYFIWLGYDKTQTKENFYLPN